MSPKDLGCLCDNCPLKSHKETLPPRIVSPKKKALALVSEYPSEQDTKQGQFFVGPTGDIIKRRLLDFLKIPQKKLHMTNALLCWPGKKLPPKEWKKAVECCRPRLSKELNAVRPKAVIAFGARSLQSLTGKAALNANLGAPIPGADFYDGGRKRGVKVADFTSMTVIPSFKPSIVYREKWQYLPVIRKHVQRAYKISQGSLPDWNWGELVLDVDFRMLEALGELLANPDPWSCDIETTGVDPWRIDITRIGFANSEVSVSVPWCDWKEVEGVRRRKTKLQKDIYEATLKLLESEEHLKVFQNGIFDRTVFRTHNIKCSPPFFDTLYAHLLYSPGTPHDLAFQASTEFHSPRWKDEFKDGQKGFEK